eukprot:TRINITY_DN2740_c0_g1_i8.p1 TRINITY_DN2740_c0_g1~~TRINITY_DN2740_c0_g1_i8.p1  ORF type:complete len:567 (-),score=62.33 TRINITY_DN2740_c0_g1_i8:33-1733(-)
MPDVIKSTATRIVRPAAIRSRGHKRTSSRDNRVMVSPEEEWGMPGLPPLILIEDTSRAKNSPMRNYIHDRRNFFKSFSGTNLSLRKTEDGEKMFFALPFVKKDPSRHRVGNLASEHNNSNNNYNNPIIGSRNRANSDQSTELPFRPVGKANPLILLQDKCRKDYGRLFSDIRCNRQTGTIVIGTREKKRKLGKKAQLRYTDRYLLTQAAGLVTDLPAVLTQLLPTHQQASLGSSLSQHFLFEFAHSLGTQDHAFWMDSRRKKPKMLFDHHKASDANLFMLEDLFGLSAFMANQGWGYIVPDSISFSMLNDLTVPFFLTFSVSHSVEAMCYLKRGLNPSAQQQSQSKNRKKWAMWNVDEEAEKEKPNEKEEESSTAKSVEHTCCAPVCTMLSGYMNGYLQERLRYRSVLAMTPQYNSPSLHRSSPRPNGLLSAEVLIPETPRSPVPTSQSAEPLPAMVSYPLPAEATVHASRDDHSALRRSRTPRPGSGESAQLYQRLCVLEVGCHAMQSEANNQHSRHCEFVVAAVDTLEPHTKRYLESVNREKDFVNIAPMLRLAANRHNLPVSC